MKNPRVNDVVSVSGTGVVRSIREYVDPITQEIRTEAIIATSSGDMFVPMVFISVLGTDELYVAPDGSC